VSRTTTELPDALVDPELWARLRERPVALFLDYDGTLTPIVARPELAVLDDATRGALEDVAERCFVAVISGRDLDDVRAMLRDGTADGGVHLWVAGSHGFDLTAPDGSRTELAEARDHLGALDAAADDLERSLAAIPDAWVERKRFAVAAHFRQVEDARVPEVEAAVDQVVETHPGLRKTGGKRIFEVRPDIDWDKGTALWSLFDRVGLHRGEVLAVFIGDDLTDEDAFLALGDDGVGIVVADEARPTAADARLGTPDDVRRFLVELAVLLEGADR
jgi:trehalose-phosphatase